MTTELACTYHLMSGFDLGRQTFRTVQSPYQRCPCHTSLGPIQRCSHTGHNGGNRLSEHPTGLLSQGCLVSSGQGLDERL